MAGRTVSEILMWFCVMLITYLHLGPGLSVTPPVDDISKLPAWIFLYTLDPKHEQHIRRCNDVKYLHCVYGHIPGYVTISDKTNLLAVKSILRYRFVILVTLVHLWVQACKFPLICTTLY